MMGARTNPKTPLRELLLPPIPKALKLRRSSKPMKVNPKLQSPSQTPPKLQKKTFKPALRQIYPFRAASANSQETQNEDDPSKRSENLQILQTLLQNLWYSSTLEQNPGGLYLLETSGYIGLQLDRPKSRNTDTQPFKFAREYRPFFIWPPGFRV